MNKRINLVLDVDHYALVETHADEQKKSRTQVIREAIRLYDLVKRGELHLFDRDKKYRVKVL